MAMSDADVQKQIKHMIAFIEQEANEKIEEIETKADEEFSLEKARIVQNNIAKAGEVFDKKEKQIILKRKIKTSAMLNQARLKILQIRDDYVTGVKEETLERLCRVTEDKEHYKLILEKMTLQALYQLMEPRVVLRCRKMDEGLVREVLPLCIRQYLENFGSPVDIEIDKDYLSSDICGGIEMHGHNGCIRCTNTLENRLELVSTKLTPELRATLFGPNEHRTFTD